MNDLVACIITGMEDSIMSIQGQSLSVGSAHRPGVKQISIQERSLVVGNFVVINGYRVNLVLLKQRFTEGG